MTGRRLASGALLAAAVVAALAVGVATAARGSASADGATPKAFPTGPVHLTMWWWGQQEAAGATGWLADTVALYEKKHPNVTIKTVLQTTNGLVPAFKAAAAAKKGPDLQYFWGGIWSLEDAWAGSTKPVSDYIPKSELKHYINTAEDTYNGKIWTAPEPGESVKLGSTSALTASASLASVKPESPRLWAVVVRSDSSSINSTCRDVGDSNSGG